MLNIPCFVQICFANSDNNEKNWSFFNLKNETVYKYVDLSMNSKNAAKLKKEQLEQL